MPKQRRKESMFRSGPTLGTTKNVSVPISFGLPLLAVGVFILITAIRTDATLFWVLGTVSVALGLVLFASGKTL